MRTYDPAGLSGDSRASERVGAAYAQCQASITTIEVVALYLGADEDQLNTIQEGFEALVERYHGRQMLFKWMAHQLQAVLLEGRDPLSYPEFLQNMAAAGQFDLSRPERRHTVSYLESIDGHLPVPPPEYFQEVASAEDMSLVLDASQLVLLQQLSVEDSRANEVAVQPTDLAVMLASNPIPAALLCSEAWSTAFEGPRLSVDGLYSFLDGEFSYQLTETG